MRYVLTTFWKGLVAVVPFVLTLYLIYWIAALIDKGLRPLVGVFVPRPYEWPGMGVAAGFIVVFAIGWALNRRFVRHAFACAEKGFGYIPVAQSVYAALRDFMTYLGEVGHGPQARQVVLVTIGEIRLLGFRTAEHVRGMATEGDLSAVYLPMSYQVGGFTVYLPSDQVVPLDMSAEEAMRRTLTGGLSRAPARTL